MNYALWTVQVLLALFFLVTGTVLTVGRILEPVDEPPIMRFIGVLLVLGALGQSSPVIYGLDRP